MHRNQYYCNTAFEYCQQYRQQYRKTNLGLRYFYQGITIVPQIKIGVAVLLLPRYFYSRLQSSNNYLPEGGYNFLEEEWVIFLYTIRCSGAQQLLQFLTRISLGVPAFSPRTVGQGHHPLLINDIISVVSDFISVTQVQVANSSRSFV